jgi:hypothetical protein
VATLDRLSIVDALLAATPDDVELLTERTARLNAMRIFAIGEASASPTKRHRKK